MLSFAAAASSSYALTPAGAPSSAAVRATRTTELRAIAELMRPASDAPAKKPSYSDRLPDCPPTLWDASDIDVAEWQQKYREEDLDANAFDAQETGVVVATAEANAAGIAHFTENAEKYRAMMQKHGTVWFRNFDLMKTPDGFRAMWEAIGLETCLDPIHTSGLRKFLSKSDAVYEEVNKQSLSKHYIGLHNESSEKKSATYGAFVCFMPATVSGGEFLIADGEKILRDIPTDVLTKLYDEKVRISVANLDLDVLDAVPGDFKGQAMDFAKAKIGEKVAPKFDMDLEMVWGTDGKDMRLQAIEPTQSPINRHPKTGRPVWFCNMHNHARFLRDRRFCGVPEVGMTDVFFGDLGTIPGELCNAVNEACEKNIVKVPMTAGDVLLIDNYRVLHGRDIFEGDRLHAVSWFTDEPEEQRKVQKPGDILNTFINKFVVGD